MIWLYRTCFIRKLVSGAVALMFVSSAWLAAGQAEGASGYSRTFAGQGIRVVLEVEHVAPDKAPGSPFEEGENVRVRFKFTEVSTGMPLKGAGLAAWLDLNDSTHRPTPQQCAGKIKRLAEGSAFSSTEVDLNSNYVLTMNAGPSISVVDPRFGFGGSRLLNAIPLKAPGEDWATSPDGTRLYVSMPKADALAVIDTNSWRVIANIPVLHQPARTALQADGEYLWVAFGATDEESGVVVVKTRELKVVARMVTGKGYHHIAFSDDDTFAFVTNPGSGSVSVIDIRKLEKVKDVVVAGSPAWIAWSSLAKAAYVSRESDGAIFAIGGRAHNVIAKMQAAPGLGQIRFAPGGRYALAVNPENDHVYVVDASVNRIIQTGTLDKGPDRIAFTSRQAYIRHRGSETVLMIGLESLGEEGKPVAVADFPGGQLPPGRMSAPSPADSIVPASGDEGVLVANPGDQVVYYYMEGMAAPSGNFGTYGEEPRAVMVLERSLRERSPGTYETVARLTSAGGYDLALLLDKPQLTQCFDFSVVADPKRVARERPQLKIEPLPSSPNSELHPRAGEDVVLRFRVTEAATSRPRTDLKDVTALIFAPGVWQRREVAQHLGAGVYAIEFRPPGAGQYNIYLAAPSAGMDFAQYAAIPVSEGAQ